MTDYWTVAMRYCKRDPLKSLSIFWSIWGDQRHKDWSRSLEQRQSVRDHSVHIIPAKISISNFEIFTERRFTGNFCEFQKSYCCVFDKISSKIYKSFWNIIPAIVHFWISNSNAATGIPIYIRASELQKALLNVTLAHRVGKSVPMGTALFSSNGPVSVK